MELSTELLMEGDVSNLAVLLQPATPMKRWATATSRTLPGLPSGWECRGRRLFRTPASL